jgi:hypothetical protein
MTSGQSTVDATLVCNRARDGSPRPRVRRCAGFMIPVVAYSRSLLAIALTVGEASQQSTST